MTLRGELIEPFHANYSYNIYKHQLDFWTPTNTDARWPRLTAPGSTSNRNNYGNGEVALDLFLMDGKYLRLKNLQIGYTFPKTWSRKVGMEKARIYVNGQNLLTFSNNSFIDPESSEFDSKMGNSGAILGRNYPTLRYYGFGIDIEILKTTDNYETKKIYSFCRNGCSDALQLQRDGERTDKQIYG